MTYRVDNMPISMFMRTLATDSGLSIVWEKSLDDTQISLSVENIPATDVLTVVARRLGVDLANYGDLYYLGTIQKTDRASFVTKVNRVKRADIIEILDGVKSPIGMVTVLSDGTVIMADRIESINKADHVLKQIQKIDVTVWFMQLYLADYSITDDYDIGLDTTQDIELAATLVDSEFNTSLTGDFGVSLSAELSRSDIEIVAAPMMIMVDGSQSNVKKVERIPIPQYTTSDQGTVSVSGYTEVESGFELLIGVRDWADGRANVTYDLESSEVTGYVNSEVPIISSSEISGEVVVQDGGVYLLGSLTRNNATETTDGLFGLRFTGSHRQSLMRLWAKVQRITPEV